MAIGILAVAARHCLRLLGWVPQGFASCRMARLFAVQQEDMKRAAVQRAADVGGFARALTD